MSIDACKHSLFGASKVAADVLVLDFDTKGHMKRTVFGGFEEPGGFHGLQSGDASDLSFCSLSHSGQLPTRSCCLSTGCGMQQVSRVELLIYAPPSAS